MKATPTFSAFTSGELSPLLEGRTDLEKYFKGAKVLENMIVKPQGGVTRRPGTVFVAEVENSSKESRLVPFEFNVTQAYVLEFCDEALRIYKDGGQIVSGSAKTVSGATNANPCVVTATSHGFENGDEVFFSSVGGMTELNEDRFKVVDKTTNTFEIQDYTFTDVNSTNFGTYTSGGTVDKVVKITTPYAEEDLAALKFTQSADVMYITHPSHAPRKLTRTSHTAWTISEVDFIRGPMGDENTTATTLTANNRTGSVTISASADLFASTDVGRLVKLHDGYAKITAFTDATTVTATVQENELGLSELAPVYASNTLAFVEGDPSSTGLEHNDRITDSDKQFIAQGFKVGQTITASGASTSANNTTYLIVQVTEDTILFSPSDDCVSEAASATITLTGSLTADANFRLGAFSSTTGFPSAVAFYEQRLVFAGTSTQPQTLFFSVSGDFENFTLGTDATSSMTYTIGSNQVNIIRYLASSRSLLVGTSGGEFAVRAGDTDEALTPTNIQIKQQANYGSADVQPVLVSNAALFIQRAKRKLRELIYNIDTDSYFAPDLTILSEHITENGIKEASLMQEPDNIIWCVRRDGVLVGLTYRREEDIVAWHRHKIAGTFTGTHLTFASKTYDHGMVESVASIPSDLNEDQVYMIVKRTVDVPLLFTATADTANDRITSNAHGLSTGTQITFETNGTSPTGAQAGDASNLFKVDGSTTYFVRNISANVFSIFIDSDGATNDTAAKKITFSDAGTGTMTVYAATRTTRTRRFIEYFNNFDFGDDVEDSFFLDSGLTYTGGAASQLTNLDHLRGQTVSILTNGATHPTKHVAARPASINLERTTTKAHVGLPFSSTVQTMRIDRGSALGTAQGKIKRINAITLRLFRTVGVLVGESTDQTDRIDFRSSADAMDTAVPLFSGDKEVEFDGGFNTDAFVVVQQDQPLPLTLLAVIPRVQTFDE